MNMPVRISRTVPDSLARRGARACVLSAMLLAAASCSLLPPSMHKQEAAAPAPAAEPQVAFGPAPAGPATTQPQEAPRAEAKVFKGSGIFLNPAPPRPPGPPGPEEVSLNYEALDVREVAKNILGDNMKVSYTVHPAVQGTITFRTVRPIPVKDLLPTLEMLLRQNNAAVVREDGIYKILPINQVRGSITPQLGGSTLPIPQGFSVLAVPLKYVGAREMYRLIEPFAPADSIRVDEVRNIIIIAGAEREMRHLIDTIDLFDVDWLAGYSMGLFPIRSAEVKTLVADLDKVFGASAQSPLAGIVRVIPIERLNALLVVTTQPKYLDMAKTWIDRIDQAGTTTGGARFYVYHVRNGKAESLAQLISDLFSAHRTTTTAAALAPGSRPAQLTSTPYGQSAAAATTTTTVTPPPGASFQIPGLTGTTASEVRVIADKDTNSLLILATPADYDTIESALRQLDVVPRQVLVEVMLAEVTLSDNLSLGLNYFLSTRNNTRGYLQTGNLGTTGGDSTNGIAGIPAPGNPVPGISGGLQLINFVGTDVRAVLNALGSDGKAKVLASPQIMVLDNQKAQIKVGDRISVQTSQQTGVTTSTGVVNSFQYLETGVLLAVTPRINSGGLVTLDVSQEVSVPDTTVATTPSNPNPNVNSRSAQTVVVVASGDSIVLGGLIREDNNTGSQGIPLLSKIPVLGVLFGTQSLIKKRTELVLIITPRIISDSAQAREATLELRKKLPALEGMLPRPQDLPPLPAATPPSAPK
jgi:general secretion pathway protein D